MKSWLVDTGPLVAYQDAGDSFHSETASLWDNFTGRLCTTSAVITEAMHFVTVHPEGPASLAELIAASSTEVYDLTQPPELRQAVSLMKKYSDIPMDFTDATLVLLAEAIDVHDILTLDRRGFAVFRTRKNRALQNVIDMSG